MVTVPKLETLIRLICAGRSSMRHDEFVKVLEDLVFEAKYDALKPAPISPPAPTADTEPHIVPMKTKEQALADHAARQQAAQGVRSGSVGDPRRPGVPLTEEDKAKIRERYQRAKLGKVRVERGWIKRVAEEYMVSDALVYNVIYTDPNYQAVPR